jgi:predicted cobalt transporter CbtA
MRIVAKVLQAVGIAEVMIGLVTGLMGNMRKEMYFALAGIVVFSLGWLIQRLTGKRATSR